MNDQKLLKNIDPRILLIFTLFNSVYILIEQSIINLFLLALLFFVLTFLRHVELIKNVLLIYILSGLMILLFLYFLFPIETSDLIMIYFRIISISGLYMIFYAEINPENLAKTLIYFKMPYRYAWTISTSYRYIFLLIQVSQEVKNALLLRGIALDGNIIDKLRNLPIIISQLIFRTNYLSLKFSEALFAKSWSPYGEKTFYHELNIFASVKINAFIVVLQMVLLWNLFTAISTL